MMFHKRILLDRLTSNVSRHKIRLLFGARQTGKTELLRHAVPEQTAVFYSLDQPALRRRLEADPAVLGRELSALSPQFEYVVVDEVQKVPDLLDEIQASYDRAKSRFQFFLTGSSARRLRRQTANLLPGRSHVFHLYPICRWEEGRGDVFDWPGAIGPATGGERRTEPPFPARSLADRLAFGGLPAVQLEPPETARATLDAYVENYLEEEVRREALARDLGAFSSFVRLSALESGRQVNLTALSQESGVPASTLKNYYDVLVTTFVGFWMRPYGGPTRKRLLTTPRFFYFDLGVRNAAAALLPDARLADTDGPALFEQWVAIELRARAGYLGRGYDVSFWRTVSGAEVDFVWQAPREDVPVEVKWTERPRPEDARHLERFLDTYSSRARRGLLVCRSGRAQQLTERVTAVPWDAL
jgi:uncharacterized protein